MSGCLGGEPGQFRSFAENISVTFSRGNNQWLPTLVMLILLTLLKKRRSLLHLTITKTLKTGEQLILMFNYKNQKTANNTGLGDNNIVFSSMIRFTLLSLHFLTFSIKRL